LSEPEDLVEELARMLAKARTGSSVYMSGAHNPVPSEYKSAEEFVRKAMSSDE
jgi:hypothetical protein